MDLCYFSRVFFAFIAFGIHTTHSCSSDKITICFKQFEQLAPEDIAKLDKICPLVQSSMDCLDKKIEACPQLALSVSDLKERFAIEKMIDLCRRGHGKSCDYGKIIECRDKFLSMTSGATNLLDIEKLCQSLTDGVDCVEEKTDKNCPSLFDSAPPEIKTYISFCEGRLSSCSLHRISDCLRPVLDLTTTGNENDVTKTCKISKTAADCLNTETATCSAELTKYLSYSKEMIELLQKPCDGSEDENTSNGCSFKRIKGCTQHLMSVVQQDYYDIDKICRKSMAAIECLEEEIKSCPAALHDTLKYARDSFSTVREICHDRSSPNNDLGITTASSRGISLIPDLGITTPSSGGASLIPDTAHIQSSCKYSQVLRCMMHNQEKAPKNMEETCSNLDEQKSCVEKFKTKCSNPVLMRAVTGIEKQNDAYRKKCQQANFKTGKGNSADGIMTSIMPLLNTAVMIVFLHFM